MVETPDDEYITVRARHLHAAPDAHVTVVRLERPAKGNALPLDSIGRLADVFNSVERSDGDALVIAGAGTDFSMGTDLADLDPATVADPADLARVAQDLVASIRTCPLPVLARVQGRAVGVGFLCCLGADLVVAADDASFGLPEADLGIPVAGFATTLLPRLVGERRAREWLFTGATIDAGDAAAAGFVTRSTDPASLDATVDELLSDLVGSSTSAVGELKRRMAPLEARDIEAVRGAEQSALRAAYREGDAPARIDELL